MQIVIDIPDAPIGDYLDLFYKIHGMAASEGLFDDKEKSQRALALKVVLDILDGIVKGTPLLKGHGRLIDADKLLDSNGIIADSRKCHYIPMIDVYDAQTIIEADKAERM